MNNRKKPSKIPRQFKLHKLHREIDLAELELNHLTIQKLKSDIWKVNLENIFLFLGLAFIISFTVGGILLLIYFVRQNFNSGGLSVADTLSFSLISLSFIGFVITILLFGTVAAFPVAKIIFFIGGKLRNLYHHWGKKNDTTLNWRIENSVQGPVHFEWKRGEFVMLFCGLLLFLVFVFSAYFGPLWMTKIMAPALAAGILLSSFMFGTYTQVYSRWEQDKRPLSFVDKWERGLTKSKRQWLIACLISSSLVGLQFGLFQDLSLATIGIRKLDVAIQVNKDDFIRISRRATELGIVINKCESIDIDFPYIRDVDILWHKFGTQASIRLPSQPLEKEDVSGKPIGQLKTEINNASFNVVTFEGSKNKCEEFLSDNLFDSSGKKISERGVILLKHELEWLNFLIKDLRVKIATHTTYPFAKESIENKLLASLQANLVKEFIIKEFKIEANRLSIDGLENLDPKQDCENIIGLTAKKICEKANRRTVVFVN